MVEDAPDAGARYLFAAGDITAEAVPLDLSRAGKLLNRFGRHQHDYFVTRGNHDRSHTGTEYAQCRVREWEGNDCFHDQFFPGNQPTYFSRSLAGLRVLGIDTYDKAGRGSDHTHRNKRTVSPLAPAVTSQEIAAVKEYPGGFSLLRLYTGGFALNFHKTRSALSREWSERSRQEISGAWPQFAFGTSVADRTTVVKHDLSDLQRPSKHSHRPSAGAQFPSSSARAPLTAWRTISSTCSTSIPSASPIWTDQISERRFVSKSRSLRMSDRRP